MEIYFCELKNGVVCNYKETDLPSSASEFKGTRYCNDSNAGSDCKPLCNRAEIKVENIKLVDNGDGSGPS